MVVFKRTGRMPEELAGAAQLPPEAQYLWQWYWEMFTPPARLNFSEIKAWMQLSNHRLMAWEVKALRRLDEIRFQIANGD